MDNLLTNKYVILLCRFVLGGVFVYASIDKIVHPEAFAGILHNYKLLPDYFIYGPALYLPWVELIAGSFLIAGIFTRGSSVVLNALLIIFIAAITINIIRGISFDCGCFSTSQEGGGNVYLLLLRDCLLLFPGLLVLYYYINDRRRNENNNKTN